MKHLPHHQSIYSLRALSHPFCLSSR